MNFIATLTGMTPKMCGTETRQALTFEITDEDGIVPAFAEDLQEELSDASMESGLPAMPLVEVFKATRWTSVSISIQDPLHSGRMAVCKYFGGGFIASFECRLLELKAALWSSLKRSNMFRNSSLAPSKIK